ncbi:MAG: tRNA 2-thiocytidine biosynthesis protein TtcA [Clostridia bacterium]|nr:tRNA 2-thiocytidine biosynthesis protein TtcA [Clostridia bacterium]
MQKVLSGLRKAVEKYRLIENGDKIAVGVSGGKDSLVLLKALKMFQKFNLYKYELVAVVVDLYSGKGDYTNIKSFCEELEVPLVIEQTDINEIVFNLRKEPNPCSLCAKMRRGVLNTVAIQNGCNKIALGHHLQDVIETFFLSLLYEGKMSTMKPKSYMSKSNITLIRPLFLTHESTIASASKNLPVQKSICPADKNSKRQEVEKLIKDIDKLIPDAKKRIESAILSTELYNLLDKE